MVRNTGFSFFVRFDHKRGLKSWVWYPESSSFCQIWIASNNFKRALPLITWITYEWLKNPIIAYSWTCLDTTGLETSHDYHYFYASSLWLNMSMYPYENATSFSHLLNIFILLVLPFLWIFCRIFPSKLKPDYAKRGTKWSQSALDRLICIDWINEKLWKEISIFFLDWMIRYRRDYVSCWMRKWPKKSCLPSMYK